MAKRKFLLTPQELKTLQAAFQQEKDGPTRTRYQAVRMYGQGYPVSEIQTLTGCARSSLLEWGTKFRELGVAGLQDHRGGPRVNKLTDAQREDLRDKLLTYPPSDVLGPQTQTVSGAHWTVSDLHHAVEKWYGVTYQSRTSYLTLLAACGFSYQRTEKVFKSRKEHQVLAFEADTEKKSSI